MQRYPVLHSGFIATVTSKFTKTEAIENPYVENLLLRESGNNEFAGLFYSKDIQDLYVKFSGNRNNLRDFEFREQILRTARSLIGSFGLMDWTDLQNKHGSLSNFHIQFIIETMLFINTGSRPTSISIWEGLVRYSPNGRLYEIEKSEDIRALSNEGKAYMFNSTAALLNKWVSHRGGYEDLLYTLWIIFGDRSYAHLSTIQKSGA